MLSRKLITWATGGLMSVALLGIPACQTTSKEEPQALTGQADEQPSKKQQGDHRFVWRDYKR